MIADTFSPFHASADLTCGTAARPAPPLFRVFAIEQPAALGATGSLATERDERFETGNPLFDVLMAPHRIAIHFKTAS